MNPINYQKINQQTINNWIDNGWEWGQPISHTEFEEAKNGNFAVKLTPTKSVPKNWIGDLRGKKVLGLASGGGQQMPIFTALGAACTVLDYSDKQIEQERMVAQREGYLITLLQEDMSKPLPFADDTFDMIFHPVSNCYIEDVKHFYRIYNLIQE